MFRRKYTEHFTLSHHKMDFPGQHTQKKSRKIKSKFEWLSIPKYIYRDSSTFFVLVRLFFSSYYQPHFRQYCPMKPWWCHQMETFSALLACCEGNPPVTGGFPSQRLVTRSFDVFFDLRPHNGQWRKALTFSLIFDGFFEQPIETPVI